MLAEQTTSGTSKRASSGGLPAVRDQHRSRARFFWLVLTLAFLLAS